MQARLTDAGARARGRSAAVDTPRHDEWTGRRRGIGSGIVTRIDRRWRGTRSARVAAARAGRIHSCRWSAGLADPPRIVSPVSAITGVQDARLDPAVSVVELRRRRARDQADHANQDRDGGPHRLSGYAATVPVVALLAEALDPCAACGDFARV